MTTEATPLRESGRKTHRAPAPHGLRWRQAGSALEALPHTHEADNSRLQPHDLQQKRQNWSMPTQGDLAQRIRMLSDNDAIRALAAVVEDRGLLPVAEQLPQGTELRNAVDAVDLNAYLQPGEVVTEGELARTALECASALHADLASTVSEAVEYAQSPTDRIDPITLSVTTLAIALLQTEVVVKRDPRGKWSLTIHKRAARDSTVGKLLTALLSRITGGQ
ncbi:hypothetical protein LN042_32925 [Kitasatospora sp. RB6PN24]|uniref:hypothetical protein n=1 Tax=Kitasatospora humi TaxID=2893891 RepID=UPI001E3FD9BC|nr:hypothetical protein [Kitasatospora humi]MCC9311813.1 hypothetical protein [Kitasatospora humi]